VGITSTVSNLLQTVQHVHSEHNSPGTGLFGLAVSVSVVSVSAVSVMGRFGLGIFRSQNICA